LVWFLWLQFAGAICVMWIAMNLCELYNCKVLPLPLLWCLMFLEGNGSWVVLFLGVSFRRLRNHPWFCIVLLQFFPACMWSPLKQISTASVFMFVDCGWSQQGCLNFLESLCSLQDPGSCLPLCLNDRMTHQSRLHGPDIIKARTESCVSVGLCTNWPFDSTGPGTFCS
jgi:hypothetical protein